MTSNRADLDNISHNSTYITLTVILIILSVIGIVIFFQFPKTQSSSAPTPIPTLTSAVTPTIAESSSSAKITLKPTVTIALTSVTPTPTFQTFTSDTDSFTVIYRSNRKPYQDTETSGNRYTFSSMAGNIAVHVGTSWSWTYPNRQFSQGLLVSGNSTFVYEITSQTIVDFQVGSKDYTVQCIHNGNATLKAECTQFLNDFKIN